MKPLHKAMRKLTTVGLLLLGTAYVLAGTTVYFLGDPPNVQPHKFHGLAVTGQGLAIAVSAAVYKHHTGGDKDD